MLHHDQVRFRNAFEANANAVRNLMLRHGLQDADASDVRQRTFIILARKIDQVGEGRERAFLFATAIRILRETRRSYARRREDFSEGGLEVVDHDSRPDAAAERRHAHVLVSNLLSELPTPLRDVFERHELREMTRSQIACALDIPMGTVASRLRRARVRFGRAVRRRFRVAA
jgi:RNA polymerase sigma-70 factor (ECF subfamily)